MEYVIIEIWTRGGNIKIVNFYNPCCMLSIELLKELAVHLEGKVIWCGDFNAHSTVWGNCNDNNGMVIEELMEEKKLVCLNDGSGTRSNIRMGTVSAIDLTLVSHSLAGVCSWEVNRETTVGSDHYPIFTVVGLRLKEYDTGGMQRWSFSSADWNKFELICD